MLEFSRFIASKESTYGAIRPNLVLTPVFKTEVGEIHERSPRKRISLGIDRPVIRVLLKRLTAAAEAGKLFTDIKLGTDAAGNTYVDATTNITIRRASQDLTRLGF